MRRTTSYAVCSVADTLSSILQASFKAVGLQRICCGRAQDSPFDDALKHTADKSILIARPDDNGRVAVLGIVALLLLTLWILGWVTSYTLGGLIHLLLAGAIIVIAMAVIHDRRV